MRSFSSNIHYDRGLATIRLARNGPVKVFGENVDERKRMSEEQAQRLFDERWKAVILPAMLGGRETSHESARMRLHEASLPYLRHGQLLWEFDVQGLDFIAQIDTQASPERLTQLWSVTSIDKNPKLLRVVFDTVEERKRFGELSASLGWKDEELGLALVRDFMQKHHRIGPAGR